MGIPSTRLIRGTIASATVALLLAVGSSVSAEAASLVRPSDAHTAASVDGRFGKPFDIDPYGQPQRYYAKAVAASADAHTLTMLNKIASQPEASWFGHLGTASVEAGVRQRVEHARKNGTVAVLVAYNIPFRDCGMYAAGQLTTASQYEAWIRGFVRGLGKNRAVVVVEPDALAQTKCLSHAQTLQRYVLLRYAVRQIAAQGSWAYLDAGHSKWKSVRVISNRLRAAGVKYAAGFSLNVSNFRPDAELIAYGMQVSDRVGGKHFAIDSSRNGVTPVNQAWCNPPGKGLGHVPTAATGVKRLDAYLWVKTPGGSDGTCNGGPHAGAWYQQYAVALAEQARLG